MSDDGDHVGTVQYSLTDSSCVEASSLPSVIKGARIVYHNDAYVLRDGFQGIMDVAQLSAGNELVTRLPRSMVGRIKPRSRMVHPDEHPGYNSLTEDAETTWGQ